MQDTGMLSTGNFYKREEHLSQKMPKAFVIRRLEQKALRSSLTLTLIGDRNTQARTLCSVCFAFRMLCHAWLPSISFWNGKLKQAFNPSTWELRQENRDFKASPVYMVTSSPDWAT